MAHVYTPQRLILGLFPLAEFVYRINGPFSALLRSPQYLIIEFLYNSGMRKLKNLATYDDDSYGSYSQDSYSYDDMDMFDYLYSWLPTFSNSSVLNTTAVNDSAMQLFGADTNYTNISYPLVEPLLNSSLSPEFTPIESPLLSSAPPSSSSPRISSNLSDDFSVEGLYLMLAGKLAQVIFPVNYQYIIMIVTTFSKIDPVSSFQQYRGVPCRCVQFLLLPIPVAALYISAMGCERPLC